MSVSISLLNRDVTFSNIKNIDNNAESRVATITGSMIGDF